MKQLKANLAAMRLKVLEKAVAELSRMRGTFPEVDSIDAAMGALNHVMAVEKQRLKNAGC